ncbi:sugar-binding transcriptional regulator [Lacticaseibacillus paracasei]|uniref:HTH cro/C1-type domain-containing protein n=1 Tax=Lacticaseibacillus paracasei NRIC 0644 TaxID=1435038 RepID=A0A0C9Q778_LACPA|nr:sugar-binding domain-containing protein [Lacticaseibacillus paracasei]GAN35672.1 hypothetical protein LC0644_0261 [Lacticaseibacillus paracasei NRIC 0644]GAN38193.1 hypothetical protein LC1917_0070 [Lacticaseibacillus paracasei NRIC 1917]
MVQEVTDRELILKVAILYYEHNLTQEEVASRVGVSRPAISKLLQRAKDLGLVRFFIQDINKDIIELEVALQEKYHLTNVKVVSSTNGRTSEAIQAQVGQLSARYMASLISKGNIKSIGIGWGRAVANLVAQTDFLTAPQLTIVPLIGGLGLINLEIHSDYLVSELAMKLHARHSTFYAPVIADTAKEAKELKRSSLVSSAIEAAKNVDAAFIGVGNHVGESTWKELGYITGDEITELENAGAIGDAVANFFDINFKDVETEFSKRLIGITIADLMRVPNVVAMAVGTLKSESLSTLLKYGLINSLFIDQTLAEAIL